MAPNPNLDYNGGDLILDGEEDMLKLMWLTLNGRELKLGEEDEVLMGKLIVKVYVFKDGKGILKSVVEIDP